MSYLPQLISVQSVLPHTKELATNQYEQAVVLLLDKNNHLLKKLNFSDQQPDRLVIPARKIFEAAFASATSKFILVHNHPSGKVTPSMEDHHTTERLSLVGRYLNINLIDHIIVVPNDYFSFCEEGILSGYQRP